MPPAKSSPPAASSISIALNEDDRLVREGLTALINQQPGLSVIAVGSADESLLPKGANPNIILLDIGFRGGDSLNIAQQTQLDFPGAKVIIMDLLPAHEDIVEFVNVGVSGFIMKDPNLDELVSTIRAVAAGVNVLPLTMVNTLFSEIAREAVVRGRPDVLESVRMTPRERQVIDLIADGMSNKEIAANLHLAVHTVKSHVRNVMEKLTLHSRLQIAAYVRSEAKR